jgi:Tfp pilus assembly protein PilO
MKGRGREIYIIAGVLAVVVAVAWFFLLFHPLQKKLSDLDATIGTKTTQVTQLQGQYGQLLPNKNAAPQNRADLVTLSKVIPGEVGVPSLIWELTATAADSGVDLQSITPGVPVAGTPFSVQPLTISVVGKYFDVEDFLYRVENYVEYRNDDFLATGRLVQVTNLSLTPAAVSGTGGASSTGAPTTSTHPDLNVTVTLDAYLWGSTSKAGTSGGGQ